MINLISVIIATYNRCQRLKGTLDSLLVQELNSSFDYEVIVVDNNSNDKTKEIFESYKEKFNGRLRYIFEPIQGKPYALNTGIKEAKGEIIAFTDDDCIVDKRWVLNISNVFQNKLVDMVGGKVMPILPASLPKWLSNYKDNLLKYPLMYYDLGDRYIQFNHNIKIFPIGANMIVRKSSFNKFGNFQDVGRSEDMAFCYRWNKLGAKIAYSPDIVVYHYTHPHRLNKSYFRKYFFQVGIDHAEIYQEKYIPGKHFLSVPIWLYRELILITIKFLISILKFDSNYFLNELKFYYTMGIILNLHGFGFNFKNLR
ncbi:MAG: glycosyltransferase [Candidatus Omnitrophica bacterium]|nr:glycosyltransferase [Candidatus Omnitrophota bacterium]MCM8827320.1 glycosyltransferase [Candidatus Omnitrophota bacterium]